MQQEVIITKLTITQPLQMVYFQIPLPPHTAFLEGIETSVRFPDKPDDLEDPIGTGLFSRGRNRLAGELKLQACGKAGVFFSHDVMEERNVVFGDFSNLDPWTAEIHSHGGTREIEPVWISGESTLLLGSYKSVGFAQHSLTICLWIRTKEREEKTNKAPKDDHCISI